MATVSAPLFSLDASGSVGKTIVYSRWHGRAYVRRLVTPLNPQTADQVAVRNAMRVLSQGVAWAQLTALVNPALTLTDKAEIKAVTPSEYAWNGYITEKGIGANKVDYDAATAAFTALQAAEKTAWDDAAAALTPAIGACAQGQAGGGYGANLQAGAVFFHWVYALYKAGLLPSAPGAVPPVYA